MISSQKRNEMENLIYTVFSKLDKSKTNTKKYKYMFEGMSDAQFDRFFKQFFADEDCFLTLDIVDYERDLTIEDIEDAANVLNIPLFERVAFPHYTMDKNNAIVSKEKVPVGYVHIKRTQQTLAKKNGLSTNIDTRSATTGQVTGKDKNGRESDLENSMLIAIGMEKTLQELNGPRADDMYMKQQMLTAINNKGYVSLEDMESDPANKTTLNTVDTYLLGMGLNSDLVTRGLMLKTTLDREG